MKRDIFQAIADPTRRSILAMLAGAAMTPGGLAGHFSTSRQAVSKHIRVLKECGAVKLRRDGRKLYYYTDLSGLKEIDSWLEQFRQLWDKRFDQLDQVLSNLKSNTYEN